MEMTQLNEACNMREWLPNDMLEAYIELASLYSMKHWLILQGEFLYRMEFEKSKV